MHQFGDITPLIDMIKAMLYPLFICLIQCFSLHAQDIRVHDPVMIREDSTYYLFCTGQGISVFSSKDMKRWKREDKVFAEPPQWALKAVPGFKGHIWAPDISYHDGKYYLYYSVSAFGKNTSCIGLAINSTLNPDDPNFKWEDQGKVIQSVSGRDMWNAIDPNLIMDEDGTPWLSFGSFWNGIKLVKLRNDLTSIAENPQEWHTLASRPRKTETGEEEAGSGAIEAPFIFKKNGWYYLFVSFDYCCRGIESNYKIMVGRADSITGPYKDRNGQQMVYGGGTLVLQGNQRWPGVGHNAVYTFDDTDYLVFHAYDAEDEGKPKLRIEKLQWDAEGWPVVEWQKR